MSDFTIPDNPVSPQQKAQLIEAQRLIPILKQHISKAKSAGIDVTYQEEQLQELEKQVKRLLSVYG